MSSTPTDHRDVRVADTRIDAVLGTTVHVVDSRQARPNLPSSGCPFCPGGLEAPDPYDVRWFPNRWPAMSGDRCEVVLYSPQHDATLWSLGVDGIRRVIDLWAERTQELGARDDVDFVLVFENRGAEVGATISHPHGQIYAYDHVPDRPRQIFESSWHPDAEPGDRSVAGNTSWTAYVPYASTYPIALTVAPRQRVPDLPHLSDTGRDQLAALLVDVFSRLDRMYDQPLPYMMWLMQRPPTADAEAEYPEAWLQIEIVSPWRGAGVARYIAAAELACGEYFNPVRPEALASQLRQLG